MIVVYLQAPPLDNYHETSLSGRNGAQTGAASAGHPGSPDPHHEGAAGLGGLNHKDHHEQELFIDPVSCPRYEDKANSHLSNSPDNKSAPLTVELPDYHVADASSLMP